MTDAELWAAWRFWMVVAGVIVVAAAVLLVIILVTARRILAEAERVLAAAEEIRRQTEPIWQLQDTNALAERMVASVRRIESTSTTLVRALHGEDVHAR